MLSDPPMWAASPRAILQLILSLLILGACSGGDGAPRVEGEGRVQEILPVAWVEDSLPPAPYRPLVASARAEEDLSGLRSHAPEVERSSWDSLVITARDGSRHVFADEVVGEDLRWVHLFRGSFDPIEAYVVERRYIPEGGGFLLVEAGTGRITRIDALPEPAPDGRRFATASLDLVAGHSPNRIRVYRVEAGGPVVEWEIEPREWGAQRPTWLDDRTIRLERAVVDWNTHGLLSSHMTLRGAAGGWTIESSSDHALDALRSFLSALGTGQYIEATLLYGGTYEQLRTWNPEHDPDDRNGLWRLACEYNGLQCLGRAEVVRTEQLSPTEVRFAVRLLDRAGNLFVLGPCCGETEQSMPPTRDFTFRVQRIGAQYLVMDLPPYMP